MDDFTYILTLVGMASLIIAFTNKTGQEITSTYQQMSANVFDNGRRWVYGREVWRVGWVLVGLVEPNL